MAKFDDTVDRLFACMDLGYNVEEDGPNKHKRPSEANLRWLARWLASEGVSFKNEENNTSKSTEHDVSTKQRKVKV